jgi:AraC family transcriptional regulator of adaptative response/methylated-DNA-[protein]-cysteine methyltransferase
MTGTKDDHDDGPDHGRKQLLLQAHAPGDRPDRCADGRDLSLEDLAADMNLSPAHFQRVFSRWAGVSPKRFQQWLTLDHARHSWPSATPRLRRRMPWACPAPGRLHDLFVRWEAMSPGDYARAAQG